MAKHGKKFTQAESKVEHLRRYGLEEGISLVKELSFVKFDESVDVAINLNVNPRHADQMVRGSVALPHGTGKATRVLVFAKGEKAKEAEDAGADVVGAEDLIEKISGGWTDWDVTVATPDMMGVVGRIGRILGPRGLMPNPKAGTVTFDVAKIVAELKAGRTEFRVDKGGIIHIGIGRVSFSAEQLAENLAAVADSLVRLKPASSKSPYFKNIGISSTMGPGVRLDTGFARDMI
ncbi:MAG: 50S ribosomal protein L1 [Bradymonadaceae bacterium]|nr:50S ribosomal protein L1 [Lujinxingiaceae bacterium]